MTVGASSAWLQGICFGYSAFVYVHYKPNGYTNQYFIRNRQIICVPQKEKPDETVRQKSQRKMNLSVFLRIHISILEIRSSSPAKNDIS